MKKQILFKLIFPIVIFIVFSGCTEEINDTVNNDGEAIVMTGEEFYDNVEDRDWGKVGESGGYSRDYTNLEDGDKLIIRDQITEIYYHPDDDKTEIFVHQYINFNFEGDITNEYNFGDTIEISGVIIHRNFTYNENYTYDIEIFEKQWVDEEFFVNTRWSKPLPQSSIKKL